MGETKNIKKTAIVYKETMDFLNETKRYSSEEKFEILQAIINYQLYGVEFEFKSLDMQAIFNTLIPGYKASNKRYEMNTENGKYGVLGGRPRKGETSEQAYNRRKKEQSAA